MLPFNQNLARLSIKVSSRSIIRKKISDDERNPTGSHEIVTSLFLLVCFYLSFSILLTDQFFALFLPALTITCNSKNDREITRTEKKDAKSYLTVQRFLFQGIFGLCSEKTTSVNLLQTNLHYVDTVRSICLCMYMIFVCTKHKTLFYQRIHNLERGTQDFSLLFDENDIFSNHSSLHYYELQAWK